MLLAAALAATQPAPPAPDAAPGRTAWLVATIGHSEWCPAGNVRLDLATGRYQVTATAPRRSCGTPGLERPVRSGVLAGPRLRDARAAFRRAAGEGLTSRACRDGGQPEQIVISNGGDRIMLVTNGARAEAAPENQSCWSPAATALHDWLDRQFATSPRR
jgi:hypothetical protein